MVKRLEKPQKEKQGNQSIALLERVRALSLIA